MVSRDRWNGAGLGMLTSSRVVAPGSAAVAALGVDPGVDVDAVIAHSAADAEAARAGAKVAPVAQRGDRHVQERGDLLEGQQLVAGWGCGHGVSFCGRVSRVDDLE